MLDADEVMTCGDSAPLTDDAARKPGDRGQTVDKSHLLTALATVGQHNTSVEERLCGRDDGHRPGSEAAGRSRGR